MKYSLLLLRCYVDYLDCEWAFDCAMVLQYAARKLPARFPSSVRGFTCNTAGDPKKPARNAVPGIWRSIGHVGRIDEHNSAC
jgi:hypothetical protein